MEIDCVLVWTTIAAAADGQKLATALVTERLAACVNVMPEMESVYRWQGRVEIDRERQVIIKTTTDRIPAIELRMRELHTYELPEFIVVPITAGSERYLQWIRESVAG
jgi:periplasmic divalent cation tolerance protein